MSTTPVQVELQVMNDCVGAISRISTDQEAVNRVMRYLVSRFPVRQQREREIMFVPEATSGGVSFNGTRVAQPE